LFGYRDRRLGFAAPGEDVDDHVSRSDALAQRFPASGLDRGKSIARFLFGSIDRVEGSTFPNWVGNVRTGKDIQVVVDGDRILESFQKPEGTKIVITWQRVP
jgi:hypothetical protein